MTHETPGEGTKPAPSAALATEIVRDGLLLSVIIPTYNECDNIARLVATVLEVLSRTPVEVIVVDDNSPDGTGRAVQELAERDPRVRLVSRQGKLGLAGAVFAGAQAARGRYVCILDGDLSHDPEELPHMLAIAIGGADIAVGSRFVPGAMFVGQPLARRLASAVLNGVTRTVLWLKPRDVLTGYILCRRELIAGMPTRHSAGGFKFLVELLVTTPAARVEEWPIRFRERHHGRSKVSLREVNEFLHLCGHLLWWRAGHRAKKRSNSA